MEPVEGNHQLLFPEIGFSCAGKITKWIIGAKYNNSTTIVNPSTQLPHLQLWRTVGHNYKRHHDHNTVWDATEYENIFESVPEPPIYFEEGDFLGVYQFGGGDTTLQIYAQNSSGPMSKAIYSNHLSDIFAADEDYTGAYNNRYILVTVESECCKQFILITNPTVPISKIMHGDKYVLLSIIGLTEFMHTVYNIKIKFVLEIN